MGYCDGKLINDRINKQINAMPDSKKNPAILIVIPEFIRYEKAKKGKPSGKWLIPGRSVISPGFPIKTAA
jgi:hypothetical protein